MPIAKWLCGGCGGREVPLDHFATTSCGLRVCHPNYAQAVLDDSRSHYAHGLGLPEVSHALGCPRQYAIMDQENVAVDPLSFNPLLTGSAFHELMASHPAPGTKTEVVVYGTLLGVRLVGMVDVIRVSERVIEDYKHHNDFMIKYVKSEGEKEDVRAQLTFYREMVQQSMGWEPKKALVWPHFSAEYGWPIEVEFLTLDELAKYKPRNGKYTTLELVMAAYSYISEDKNWQDLPLYGEDQHFGKKSACEYCSVAKMCKEADKGVAW